MAEPSSDFLETYCGSSSLSIWEDGSLSPCFQDTIMWGGLYLIFLAMGLGRIILLLMKPTNFPLFNWVYFVKTACHVFLVLAPVASLLSFFFRDNIEIFQAVYYTGSSLIWAFSLIVMNIEYSTRTMHNWVLKGFWTCAYLLSALRLQTVVILIRNDEEPLWEAFAYAVAVLCITILCGFSLFLNRIPGVKEDDYHKMSEEERQSFTSETLARHNLTTSSNGVHLYGATGSQKGLKSEFHEPSLEDQANIFSRLTFTWMDPLLKTGNRRVLEEQDLPALTKIDTANRNESLFEDKWKDEKVKEKPSISLALCRAYGLKFALAGILKLIQDALIFVGPFCLNRIVLFIEDTDDNDPNATPLWVAFVYVAVMTFGSLLQSITLQTYFFIVFRISMQIRSALVCSVYNKAFKLSNASRQGSTVGEIVNHMSIDTQRIMDLIPYLHQVWSGPLQIIICLVALGVLLGWSLLAGIALMVLLVPVNGVVIRKLKSLQLNIMSKKDERIRLTNEVLQGIRVIKFFSWEESFRATITAIRDAEIHNLRKAAYLGSIVMFMWMSTPLFVSIVTFTTYVLVGNELTATTAFTSLALFNILRFPLNVLPSILTSLVDANISIKRLHKYLTSTELDLRSISRGQADEKKPSIAFRNGSFVWTGSDKSDSEKSEEEEPTTVNKQTLSDISLEVQPGELLAICGNVGSGKSSLLNAILGDIDCVNGTVEINGSIAYVAQDAWIQNATIRDNITFGREFNQRRYNRAIRACQLEADLQIFTDGDMTEIGEKGINLSGGQKQRVSLARAVYADADIYLLDDPLSAVDAHVGLAIFNQCISETLKDKTRVLVTHQLQHLPKADRIVVLKEGKITEYGTYQELMDNAGEFAGLMKKHVKKEETESHAEAAEDDDEEEANNTTAKNKLISAEERQVGQVSGQVYLLYATSLGGLLFVAILLLLFAFEEITKVGADWWLSWWSDNPGHTEKFYIGIYASIGIANAIFVLSRGVSFAYASLNSAQKLHAQLLENIMHTPMSFFDTTPAGRILNRFSKDQYTIDQTLPRTFSMFAVMVFSAGAILVVIGAVTPFFLTAVIPLLYIYQSIQKFYIRSSREIKRLDSVSRSPIFSHFDETLTGVSTIRAFERDGEFRDENRERLDENQRAFFINVAANRWLAFRLEFLGTIIVGLASLFCVIERDNIDPGSAGLSLTYALQTTSLLNWLVRMYTETESQMVSVERIVEYSNIPTEAKPIIEHNRPSKDWPARGEIVFDNLQLRYREGLELILKGISCTIKPKEKIGIVGRTGAGKSTLMLALFRLVEAAGGSITIDGVDISKIGLSDLRSRISIIPQDPTLFTGTFRTNLDPFNSFDDDQILSVLDSVHLRALVDSNGGLQANVSEGGSNISVGQRQLMCLARALLRRSRIIVMDEATASVDFETDSLIQDTIRNEFAECTVLIIAHRIHTIESCNRVMVLDNGQIAEMDDPNELKKQEGSLFAAMVSKSATTGSVE